MPDNEKNMTNSFHWLKEKEDGRLLEGLAESVRSIQGLIELTRKLCGMVETTECDMLPDGLNRRAELLIGLTKLSDNHIMQVRKSKYRSEIEAQMLKVFTELKETDHSLVVALKEKKQAAFVRLSQLHRQKKLVNYTR